VGEDVFPFESGGGRTPSGGPGREQPEQNAGGQAEKKGEEENFVVDTDVEIEGDRYGKTEDGESAGGPGGDEDAKEAAKKGEKNAFGEDVAKELCTRGAESDANGHFALASGSLREEKIGDIGAGNEENEEDDKHERRKKEKDDGFIARRERAGLFEVETEIFFGFGMRMSETLGKELEFGGGFGA